MRVLYLTRSWGGHDTRFTEAWRSAGVDVGALAADGSAPGQRPPDRPFAGMLAESVSHTRPDVVHAGPLTDVAWAALQVWSGPLMATSWGFDLMDEVDRSDEDREHTRQVLESAHVVLVDNQAPARRAVELGADPAHLVHLPWGVDLDFFTPEPDPERPPASAERVVLCTRRHEEIYQVDVVVRAFLRVAPDRPQLHLHLAGSGSLTGDLTALVDGSPVADRVRFLGELSAAELRAAYRTATVYVSASSVDGTSVSLLEAMACGAPVCVSAIPGNAEWVSAVTGLVFPVGDVAALAAHLADLGRPDPAADSARLDRARAALDLVRRRADWRRAPAVLLAGAVAAIERHGGEL